MANTELLKRTLRHIELHPHMWIQWDYAIQTDTGITHDYAGWALYLSGVWSVCPFSAGPPIHAVPVGARRRLDDRLFWRGRDGTVRVGYAEAAAAVLDIPQWTVGEPHLFDAGNTLEELRALVEQACAAVEPEGAAPARHLGDPAAHDPDGYCLCQLAGV